MIGIGDIFNLQLAYDVLRVSTPLVLLALGALITDKAGVLNIALEGLLVFGAFAAVLGTGLSGNLVVGVLSAVVASGLLSLMFAASALYLRGNLFIVGLATNAFAAAVTTYAAWLISGREGSLRFPAAPTLPRIEVPVVEDVAALAWLSGHTVIDYLAWVTTAVVAYLLFRTRFGLRLRAVGEDASAARAAGINVLRIQYTAVLFSGILAGLAGSQLSLTLGAFVQNMSGGRGWIGLVASIVGAGSAWGSAAAAVLFGLAEGVANSLQITAQRLPTQLLFALPYLLTLIALVFYSASRRRRGSVADT